VQRFGHTATYTYDTVNRLLTAVAAPIALGTYGYNLTFNYKTPDNSTGQYGNMSCVTNAQTVGYCLNLSFNAANNQVSTSGYTYDAAGNLTKDSSNSPAHIYQWDAEGRVSAVDPGSSPTWAFTYNALGHRVQWAYGSSGAADQHLFDPAGNWLGNYGEYTLVRFGDRMLVTYESSETYFNHFNFIGSTSMLTNHAGAAAEDMLFYPWGDVWQSWGTGGYVFANLPYNDTTTNTSITLNRFYSMSPGRWLSPDPIGVKAVKFDDPQTWNMYAYVRNTPTTLTDPSGLYTFIACPGNDKRCEEAEKRFESQNLKDLKSKHANVRRAAAAYGAKGEANGVHVGFADLASRNISGTVDPFGSTPGNPNVQVTLDFGRAGSEETQTHEGTHVADDLAFLNSYSRNTGTYDQNLSITHGETEFDAYRAGAEVNHEHGFGPNDTQKIWDYIRANYAADVLPTPVFNPNLFPTGPND
jgi:RHS repeat-associated protein